MLELIAAFFSNPATAWSILGAGFVLIEVLLIPTMGFLFAGLGALTLSGLIAYDFVEPSTSILLQITYFFGLTIFWAAVMWVPLKRWMKQRESEGYTDMIGQTAVVEGANPLVKGTPGKVRWSGAAMNAMLPSGSPKEKVLIGEQVFIVGKKGNTLYVSPTSLPMPDEATLKEYRKQDKFI